MFKVVNSFGSSGGMATRLWAGRPRDRGLILDRARDLLSSPPSRLAQEPVKPPIQREPGAVSSV
jgi:hypothetical protein